MTTLFLLAQIGDQAVAFDATTIQSVVDIVSVVAVPLSLPHVCGLSAIRSQVVTVIDCRRAVGDSPASPKGRALVTSIDGHRYALRVDTVHDVVTKPVETLESSALMSPHWRHVSTGRIDMGEQFAVVVDPSRLVDPNTFAVAA